MKNDSHKESGSAIIAFFIIFLIIVIVLVSNFVGPVKGWIKKSVDGEENNDNAEVSKKPADQQPEAAKPAEPNKVVENIKEKQPETEPKSEIQEIYGNLFKKYRKKYPDPEIGKEYDIYLKTGSTRGTLKDFSDGKIIIKKPGVTVTYRLDVVSRRSYKELFPKTAAKILALRELKKILDARHPTEQEPDPTKNIPAGTTTATEKTPHSGTVKTFAYEPGSAPTPQKLQKPLASFAQWVEAQQRRIGGKIGEKVYAKIQGRNVVLYMQTSKLFDQQDYDVRFATTEAMWQIWGFKCLDNGAARGTSQTHIVLIDQNNRIIGGSRINNSSNIWVKK